MKIIEYTLQDHTVRLPALRYEAECRMERLMGC